jgi:hypothetical protein
MKKIIAVAIMAILPMFAGCGGGGGGSEQPKVVISATPGTLPAGKLVSGFGATIELPTGVTVKTKTGDPTQADPTVVVPTAFMAAGGTANVTYTLYTAATPSTKAKLAFVVASGAPAGSGVGEGDYVTITYLYNGVAPTAADFTITSFTPADQSYNALPGLTARVTLQ